MFRQREGPPRQGQPFPKQVKPKHMIASELTPAQSETLIFNNLVAAGFPAVFARLVTAQTGHETNGWTSDVYINNNNIAGYGFNGTSYKSYQSVEDSVTDLAGYIDRKIASGAFPDPGSIVSATQWADLLKSAGYYTDSAFNYANGISRWFNDNLAVVASLSVGLIIFAALGYYLLK